MKRFDFLHICDRIAYVRFEQDVYYSRIAEVQER